MLMVVETALQRSPTILFPGKGKVFTVSRCQWTLE